jgi:hypothetical protein
MEDCVGGGRERRRRTGMVTPIQAMTAARINETESISATILGVIVA